MANGLLCRLPRLGAWLGQGALAARRSHRSRGNAIIMSLVFMMAGLGVFGVVLSYGFLVLQRQQVEQTVDAVALGYAQEFTKLPMNTWPALPFQPQVDGLRFMNGTSDLGSAGLDQIDYPANLTSIADRWQPAFAVARQRMPTRPLFLLPLLNALPGGGVATPSKGFDVTATARAKQIQLFGFTFMPERVVMLLDFSATMRLQYQASSGAESNLKAYQVSQNAVKAVIDHYGPYVNIGVFAFNDGLADTDGTYQLVNELSTTKPSAYGPANYQSQLFINGKKTGGDGTDLAGAISHGLDMLADAVNVGDQTYLSQARIILITDGEPDPPKYADLPDADKVPQGRQDTVNEIARAWNLDSTKGGATGGVVTDVFFVQREGQDDTNGGGGVDGQTTRDFLQSLAGTQALHQAGASNQNYFLADAGDAGGISNFIHNDLSLQPRCYSADLRNTFFPPTPAADVLLPGTQRQNPVSQTQIGETLFAYLVPEISNFAREIPIRVFVNDLAGYTLEQSQYPFQKPFTDQPVASNYFDTANNQKALIGHYDTTNRIFSFGGMLCGVIMDSQIINGSRNQMRIRLRWGQPRLVAPPNQPGLPCNSAVAACNL